MAYRSQHRRGNRAMQQQPSRRGPPAWLPQPDPSQKLIEKLNLSSISSDGVDDKQSRIRDVEFVASFNWKEATSPTILVPGKPPKWQPLAIPQTLPEDGGLYYRDPNSARYPSYPTEPAVRAIQEVNPVFDVSSIDIFGCASTIGSLLTFVKDEDRTFRFGVELIGSSLFLVRKTNTPGELIEGVYGFGHTFLEAYTTWDKDVRESASHQRIIKYEFGGLKCFVRSESDGYLPELVDNPNDSKDDAEIATNSQQLSSLAIASSSSTNPDPDPSKPSHLQTEHAGQIIPQKAVFDLKTRSIKRKSLNGVDFAEFLPRLWANQTHNMILAYHARGRFAKQDIHVMDVKKQILDWEVQNSVVLSKLSGLLHKLISMAKKNDDCRRFEIRRTGKGPLEIWSEVPGWSALPDDLKKSWEVSGGE